MTTIKKYYDLIMPEIELPSHNEKILDAIRIKSTDDILCRQAMFTISRFFKREFMYDNFMYAHPGNPIQENDEECFSYLWTLEKKNTHIKSLVIGGFCFRLREWGYGFQWIWIHPYLRNIGLLTKHWPYLEEKFGNDFYCEPPYSKSMSHFLGKKSIKNTHKFNKNYQSPTLKDGF